MALQTIIRPKRLFYKVLWLYSELFGAATIGSVYTLLARKNFYETYVNYERRVRVIKKAMENLSLDYANVVDLACGTGACISALDLDSNKKVIGVDISEGMLETAKERFKDNKNISFVQKSFMDVDFEESSLDLVLMAFATRFIPKGKEDELFRRVQTWLKPGGIFLVMTEETPFEIISPKLRTHIPIANKKVNWELMWKDTLEKKLVNHFEIIGHVKAKRSDLIFHNCAIFCYNKP